jgi:hypothetical protein
MEARTRSNALCRSVVTSTRCSPLSYTSLTFAPNSKGYSLELIEKRAATRRQGPAACSPCPWRRGGAPGRRGRGGSPRGSSPWRRARRAGRPRGGPGRLRGGRAPPRLGVGRGEKRRWTWRCRGSEKGAGMKVPR